MLPPFKVESDFAPPVLNAASWDEIGPLYQRLIARDLRGTADLQRLILDRSELDAAVSEAGSTRYINMTCRTDDPATKAAYLDFVEHVQPRLKEVGFELDRRIAAAPGHDGLDPAVFAQYLRDVRASIELFRQENIALETELTRLDQQYAELCGQMTVNFRGREHTLQHMARYQEDPDRTTREEAWRLVAQRRLADRDTIEDLFDEMLRLRGRVAQQAGFADYRAYAFKARRRFDYGPAQCHAFAEGTEKHVVPSLRRLARERREALGVATLRPWDLAVDAQQRPSLRPFETASDLVARTARLFDRMDPAPGGLGQLFRAVAAKGVGGRGTEDGACLDLDSRKGKAPGGYQANRDRQRLPFIFMNAVGVQRDVETMVHEAGHAFHALLCRGSPVLYNRAEIPLEFAEVASMSMELLAKPFLSEFYTEADADRARRLQAEHRANLLPWVATIDQFQHWLYTNPGHTRVQRRDAWMAVRARFGEGADWSGLDDAHHFMWHRQSHLFTAPFYYIEYGIAQLGALQVEANYRRDPQAALDAYKHALAFGASRTLPDLFTAAGIEFDFSPARIASAWNMVEDDLAALPD